MKFTLSCIKSAQRNHVCNEMGFFGFVFFFTRVEPVVLNIHHLPHLFELGGGYTYVYAQVYWIITHCSDASLKSCDSSRQQL